MTRRRSDDAWTRRAWLTPGARVRAHRALALAALFATAASPLDATARETLGVPLRFGASAGYQLTSSDFDVLGDRRSALRPGDGAHFALRLGWSFADMLELELAASLVAASTPTPEADALLLPAHVDLVVRPFAWPVSPYASLGAGLMALVGGDSGHDADLLLHGALGLEVVFDHTIALRAEVGLYGTDAVDGAMSASPLFSLGLDLLAWRPLRDRGHLDLAVVGPTDPARPPQEPPDPPPGPAPPPLAPAASSGDRDRDDVDDEDDRCPDHPGSDDHEGCPDTDDDDLADPFDRCPTQAGSSKLSGCPDGDRDGVVDRLDACPGAAGPSERYGCPVPTPRGG